MKGPARARLRTTRSSKPVNSIRLAGTLAKRRMCQYQERRTNRATARPRFVAVAK